MNSINILVILAALVLTVSLAAADPGTGESFKGPLGLQLYSLRAEFMANGAPATLDKVKGFGIKYVELAGTANMPADKYKALLEERGLKAVSGHFGYDRFKKEPEVVALEAKALGLEFAGCAYAAHKAPLDEAQAREIAAVFNKAGEALKKEGIKFFYHFHGFEFQPHKDGTLVDLIMAETSKETVFYQMDTLWVFFPGHDPAKLLEKYSGRWVSMHLKDLKNGIATGSMAGKTDVKNNVVLGTGQLKWAEILAAAQKAGVKYYFIEDESPDAAAQIPETMKYLEKLKVLR